MSANAVDFLLGDAQLARHGARTALICGDASLTYVELAREVARSAGALRRLGVQPGDRVLFLMRDTLEFAAAWLGAVHAGAVAIALNTRLSEQDYRHVLADSGARLTVVEDVFAAARPDLTTEEARARRLAVAGPAPSGGPAWREALDKADMQVAHASAADAAPAMWLYSSGTTGRPKGIVHSHKALASVGASCRAFGVGAGDTIFSTSRLFFAYGLEHGLLAPLALGATSILCPDWPDPDAVIRVADAHRPSALFSVPTIYRRLLAEAPDRLAPLRGARRFVAAGERLSTQLAAQWRATVGGELLNLYGMSETFCACVVTPPGTSDGLRTGKPLPGVEARLVDETGGEPPPRHPGVLWIRHPAQASGYANLPEKTREQFRDGWFCTRDVFVVDDAGFLVHQGRSDDLVKIAGQWVQPGELEEVAAGVPAVGEAACVPVVDADGLERLALFVTAREDRKSAAQAAEAACERLLPRHKRPKWLRVVDELPRTATGKVQRFKLREILERELSGRE